MPDGFVELSPGGAGSDSSAIQTALNQTRKVYLEPGATFEDIGDLYFLNDYRLETDPDNPATLKRVDNGQQRLLTVLGSGCGVHNVRFDYNLSSGWVEFLAAISFESRVSLPDYPGSDIRENTFCGCEFFDSAEAEDPGGVGDIWGLVWKSSLTHVIRDCEMVGCRQLFPNAQLCAGGGENATRQGISITDNYVVGGTANAIALSSRGGGADGLSYTAIQDITIARNYLANINRVGIFVGQDASSSRNVDVDSVTINDNYIQYGGTFEQNFPIAVLLKPGSISGNRYTNAVVRRNTFDVTRERLFFPRGIDMQREFVGQELELTRGDNVYYGIAKDAILGVTETTVGEPDLYWERAQAI